MPLGTASTRYHVLLWTSGFLLLLLWFPRLVNWGIMDSLSSPFTIEVNGTPIAKVAANAEDRVQASTGPYAAVFTLKNGRLQSGDWVLGRPKREDRSFHPKPVLWFKVGADSDELPVQPVTAVEDGGSYTVKFPNAGLMVQDGKLLADLQGDSTADVSVKTV